MITLHLDAGDPYSLELTMTSADIDLTDAETVWFRAWRDGDQPASYSTLAASIDSVTASEIVALRLLDPSDLGLGVWRVAVEARSSSWANPIISKSIVLHVQRWQDIKQ
jgi:hypothetical protein